MRSWNRLMITRSKTSIKIPVTISDPQLCCSCSNGHITNIVMFPFIGIIFAVSMHYCILPSRRLSLRSLLWSIRVTRFGRNRLILSSAYWCGDVRSRWNRCPDDKNLSKKRLYTMVVIDKYLRRHSPSHPSPLCRRRRIQSRQLPAWPWRGREQSHPALIFRLTRATRPIDAPAFRWARSPRRNPAGVLHAKGCATVSHQYMNDYDNKKPYTFALTNLDCDWNTKPVEAALDKRPAIYRVCMDVIPLGIRPGINNVWLRWYRTIAHYPILIRPCHRVDGDDVTDFIMAEIYRHRECSFRGDYHIRNVAIDGGRVPPGETALGVKFTSSAISSDFSPSITSKSRNIAKKASSSCFV